MLLAASPKMLSFVLISFLFAQSFANPTPTDQQRRDPGLLGGVLGLLSPAESVAAASVVAPLEGVVASTVLSALEADVTNVDKLLPAIGTAIENTLPTHVPNSIPGGYECLLRLMLVTDLDNRCHKHRQEYLRGRTYRHIRQCDRAGG